MIVLCSDGLSSQRLSARVERRMVDCKIAALVVTADPIYKEKNYHVPRCVKELEQLGMTVSLFDLDSQLPDELLEYDVVEFIGGNPFYLLHSIRQHSAQDVLGKIARDKILIGWSAAAFVFGPTLALLNRYSPEMNDIGLEDLRGLALTCVEVLPHYGKFLRKFNRFEERCSEYEEEHGVQVVRLNDGEGILIDGNDIEICRL